MKDAAMKRLPGCGNVMHLFNSAPFTSVSKYRTRLASGAIGKLCTLHDIVGTHIWLQSLLQGS